MRKGLQALMPYPPLGNGTGHYRLLCRGTHYHWDLHVALPDLRIGLEDRDNQVPVFKAGVKLQLFASEPAMMGKGIFRFGAQGLATLKRIYWQAFKLWRKGAVFHGHPAGKRDD